MTEIYNLYFDSFLCLLLSWHLKKVLPILSRVLFSPVLKSQYFSLLKRAFVKELRKSIEDCALLHIIRFNSIYFLGNY